MKRFAPVAVSMLPVSWRYISESTSRKQLCDLRHGDEHAPTLGGERLKIVGAVKTGCGLVFGIDDHGMDRDLLAGAGLPLLAREEDAEQAAVRDVGRSVSDMDVAASV